MNLEEPSTIFPNIIKASIDKIPAYQSDVIINGAFTAKYISTIYYNFILTKNCIFVKEAHHSIESALIQLNDNVSF
jgi:hypothetical protein